MGIGQFSVQVISYYASAIHRQRPSPRQQFPRAECVVIVIIMPTSVPFPPLLLRVHAVAARHGRLRRATFPSASDFPHFPLHSSMPNSNSTSSPVWYLFPDIFYLEFGEQINFMQTLLLIFLLFARGNLSRPMAEEVGGHGELIEGKSRKEKCPKMPAGLEGRRKLPRETWWTSLDACLTKLNEKHLYVQMGGAWKPEECVAQQRVAILIPHRNREGHLCGLLYYLHAFMQKQQADYSIFVIDQAYPQGKGKPTDRFNRAKLFNVGFLEVLKINRAENNPDFDCFIFHDIDVVPESELNLYRCDFDYPKRFIQSREIQKYWVYQRESYATVVGLTGEQYVRINGFSNYFWGWGHEDHEMSIRIRKGSNYNKFVVTDVKDASYMSLDADRRPDDITNPPIIKECTDRLKNTTVERMLQDGVNSVYHTYKVVQIEANKLYTNITVDLMFWESINAADFPCRDLVHKMDLPKSN